MTSCDVAPSSFQHTLTLNTPTARLPAPTLDFVLSSTLGHDNMRQRLNNVLERLISVQKELEEAQSKLALLKEAKIGAFVGKLSLPQPQRTLGSLGTLLHNACTERTMTEPLKTLLPDDIMKIPAEIRRPLMIRARHILFRAAALTALQCHPGMPASGAALATCASTPPNVVLGCCRCCCRPMLRC